MRELFVMLTFRCQQAASKCSLAKKGQILDRCTLEEVSGSPRSEQTALRRIKKRHDPVGVSIWCDSSIRTSHPITQHCGAAQPALHLRQQTDTGLSSCWDCAFNICHQESAQIWTFDMQHSARSETFRFNLPAKKFFVCVSALYENDWWKYCYVSCWVSVLCLTRGIHPKLGLTNWTETSEEYLQQVW